MLYALCTEGYSFFVQNCLSPRLALDSEAVFDLAAGSGVLGCGGGGRSENATRVAALRLSAAPARLVAVEALQSAQVVCAIAEVGSPLIGAERLPSEELVVCVRETERRLGRRIDALLPLEIGGQNAVAAAFAASLLDVPLIDGDAMGRALPGVHQTSLSLGGLAVTPIVCASPAGYTVTIDDASSPAEAERVLRLALPALGGRAATTSYPATAGDYATRIVQRSVSLALALGRALRTAADADEAVSALSVARPDATVVFQGGVERVERNSGRRTIIVRSREREDAPRVLRIDADTEYVRALSDGRIVAARPDIIVILDRNRLQALPFDAVDTGQDVTVLRLPAPAIWYEPGGTTLLEDRTGAVA